MASSPSFIRRQAPPHSGPPPVTAIETTCEGVWLLQGLCGVETLPSPLLLRPYVAAGGVPGSHPGIAILRKAGALIDDQTVHPTLARWLEDPRRTRYCAVRRCAPRRGVYAPGGGAPRRDACRDVTQRSGRRG